MVARRSNVVRWFAGIQLLAGTLLVASGLPLAFRWVPPNGIYGFRAAKTLGDPSIWYSANHVAGIDLALAGIAYLGIVLMSLRYIQEDQRLLGVDTSAFLLLLGCAVGHSAWFLGTL